MLDIKQNRQARKVRTGRDDSPCSMDIRTAAFDSVPGLVSVETIPASLFRSKDWPTCACLSIGENYFPWHLELAMKGAIGRARVYL